MPPDGALEPRGGAYGARFACRHALPRLRDDAPDRWPVWTLETEVTTSQSRRPEGIGAEHARIELMDGVSLELDRHAAHIRLSGPRPVSAAAIVHPILSPAAIVMAEWSRALALHASAVEVDGRAWALLGPRGTGKSTAAAMLGAAGASVLCDDVLVVRDGSAMAGPAAVDLREEAAEHLGGEALGVVGRRARWRHPTLPGALELPLGGLIYPEWGEDLLIESMSAGVRLSAVLPNIVTPVEPEALLDLGALPALRFRRPRGFAGARDQSARLLAAVHETR